ncbi:MAG: tRNA (adenosine(37)-N6)-threonylcarbamoyltransferase complex ATPase subunit type 1 TsaE [Dehalococcoidales bacterium]
MDRFETVTHSPEETQQLGRRIGELAAAGDVYLLTGELGTGKTCLTQGIAWGLGIAEYALSPTFVIMREMHGRLALYHVDLYRLDDVAEIADLGLDDYLYGDGVAVVEWAEKGLAVLPLEHLRVEIGHRPGNERALVLTARGTRYRELLSEVTKAARLGPAG